MTQEDWNNFLSGNSLMGCWTPMIYKMGKLSAWEKVPRSVVARDQPRSLQMAKSTKASTLRFYFFTNENMSHSYRNLKVISVQLNQFWWDRKAHRSYLFKAWKPLLQWRDIHVRNDTAMLCITLGSHSVWEKKKKKVYSAIYIHTSHSDRLRLILLILLPNTVA